MSRDACAIGARLDGRVAVITGAGGGIGAATALRFASEGARLVLSDLQSDGLDRSAALVRACGSQVVTVLGDVSSAAHSRELISAANDEFGALDIVFNNAGIAPEGPIEHFSDDLWQRLLDVNLTSMITLSRLALPLLAAGGRGSIVNTSSVAGLLGGANVSLYATTKGAVATFTRALACEVADRAIRVNAVCPGAVQTAMTNAHDGQYSAEELEAAQRRFAARVPMGRRGRPDEVAAVVAMLASDDASYITGALIPIDGGWSAR